MSTYNLEHFTPEPELRPKYFLYFLLVTTLVWISVDTLLYFMFQDNEIPEAFQPTFIWITFALVVFLIIVYFLNGIYYSSISFEILDNEIHVRRGFITKSRKVVPFRTITNLDTRWGPFDRMFKLGTIEIQTAGFSAAKSGPEEKIDGLRADQVIHIQQIILDRVRRIKGSPATSHDDDGDTDVISAILIELRDLKMLLKERLQ